MGRNQKEERTCEKLSEFLFDLHFAQPQEPDEIKIHYAKKLIIKNYNYKKVYKKLI